jgi:hypothetical protein
MMITPAISRATPRIIKFLVCLDEELNILAGIGGFFLIKWTAMTALRKLSLLPKPSIKPFSRWMLVESELQQLDHMLR